jgi:hypothetical protein
MRNEETAWRLNHFTNGLIASIIGTALVDTPKVVAQPAFVHLRENVQPDIARIRPTQTSIETLSRH